MPKRSSFVLSLILLVMSAQMPALCEEASVARLGDPTAHGGTLSPGPGSPNVLINGQPAWRAQVDYSSCGLFTNGIPPLPHVGGYVVTGSSTVLINGYHAAYAGCTIAESAGAVNTILVGSPNVLCGK